MDYQVQLNNGQAITLNGAIFDAESFTESLNNREINFVNLGGAVINKHIIISIIPLTESK